MLKAPKFWYLKRDTYLSNSLYPFSLLFRLGTKLRALVIKEKVSELPIICIGNIVVGGAGKTPVSLKIGKMLIKAGYRPHFVSKGYAGIEKNNALVEKWHSPKSVGDESILLSEIAPTWVGTDRNKSFSLAKDAGADCIIMDDGFQNPTIKKDFSIIVIDGKQGFGNNNVLPAGPLRESIRRGLKRANAVIIVGKDNNKINKLIPSEIPCFEAKFDVSKNNEIFKGKNITAFAGIAYPRKFFDTLEDQGAKVLKKITFADHHIYNENDLLKLVEIANTNKSILVTTKKDFIRIPENYRTIVHKLEGEIIINDVEVLKELLESLLENFIFQKD